MPEQGYHINVSRNYDGETLWPHTDKEKLRYVHFVNVFIGTPLPDEALLFLEDTRKRYPAPEFKCTMTKWVLRGEPVEA